MPHETPTPEATRQARLQTVADAVRRAEQGDAAMVPVVRNLLTQPGFVDQLGGDLARRTEETLIAQLAGQNLLLREALLRKCEGLRAELAGPTPTPVERLLVERVVTCWLQLQVEDGRDVQSQREDMSLAWRGYLQRRLDAAHRRYLSAVKTLELVRKLAVPALPALQVNVAERQVNVVGRPGSADA